MASNAPQPATAQAAIETAFDDNSLPLKMSRFDVFRDFVVHVSLEELAALTPKVPAWYQALVLF